MAVITVNITGDLLTPDGVGVTAGRIEFELNEPGTADDGGVDQWLCGKQSFSVASDGSVDIDLVANDTITPSGTFYWARFRVRAPVVAQWTEKWDVDSADSDIGDPTRL